ncbi:efflux RND transporter periplasmic adaptor subunit [Candidatus Sulfidibacterium hydrothermale]|uniref:HlyD family secretion protein n=1 Tax=Candidatus Sulfidibacterium hydrothermale TaxID=2875962 RepID=UPI001F0B095B|nr:efflux RND transporter periplasmic adaptor subunit [Candidatus Sulfidibacterium hydrothermale]UBM61075.1 efflux RND transporter periplasmic adaptor subunit [Candidatus Sulfidibacterium hydrothermale]
MKKDKSFLALSVPVIIIIAAVIFLTVHHNAPQSKVFTGMFETTTVNVASLDPGRIDTIFVDLGDQVKKGELLARLETNILETKVGQAKGAVVAAGAMVEKAKAGARKEQIKAAENKYGMAQSQFEFAQKTYRRFQVLYADSIISQQEMDEMKFKYNAAKDQMKAAKALYDMALKGARKEDITAAEGQYEMARNKYNEAMEFYHQLNVYAPASGEISDKIAEPGEVVPQGYPILTIMIPKDIYAVLNVREDRLPLFKKGSIVKGKIPGLGGKSFDFKVSYIAPMADFATWVPTKSKGEFDMKTFEIHLKPVHPIKGLRPGMSIEIRL